MPPLLIPREWPSDAWSQHHAEEGKEAAIMKSILIVDDEKNIRLTLSECLQSKEYDIEMAETGEEALQKIKAKDFNLVLLDLRLPGMDGMELLRRIHDFRPDIRVVILSAHGTIDSAVEATRLGAVAFLQKPFIPTEIRDLVQRALDSVTLEKARESNYCAAIGLARKCIGENHLEAAMEHLRRAAYLNPSHAEAINLMGAVMELKNDPTEAHRYYLAAYSLDPTYQPAIKNLDRITSYHRGHTIDLGDEAQANEKKERQ